MPSTANPSTGSAVLDSMLAGLNEMIEAASALEPSAAADPRGPGQAIAPPPPPPAPRLSRAHGWPARYVEPPEQLHGGEWFAAKALASPVIESGGIVIFHGRRGTGKTRLAAELARERRHPPDDPGGPPPPGTAPGGKRHTALYRTAMGFYVDVRSTYRRTSETSERDIIDRLATAGLLVLDELQERGDSAFEDRLLTHLIDRRYGAGLPTLLIANLTKPELQAALGPSIIDRIAENGRRVEFTWDSYRRAGR